MTFYLEENCVTGSAGQAKRQEFELVLMQSSGWPPTSWIWMQGNRNVLDALLDFSSLLSDPYIRPFTHESPEDGVKKTLFPDFSQIPC